MTSGPLTHRRRSMDEHRPYRPEGTDLPEDEVYAAKVHHAVKVRAAEHDHRLIEEGQRLLTEFQTNDGTAADAFRSYMSDLLKEPHR
jgi:hypothetical protein